MPIYEQADILFKKLVNDEPIVLGSNTGQGAVLATPTPTPTLSTKPTPGSPTPTPTPTDSLDWATGTTAATKTCSN
jgi:hypothetical protein